MITIFSSLNSAPVRVSLPDTFSWGIYFPTLEAKRTAVAGNVIVQTAEKSLTGGTATYDGDILSDDADTLVEISRTAVTVTLTDSTGVYESTIDVKPPSLIKNGKRRVVADFTVIRKIV